MSKDKKPIKRDRFRLETPNFENEDNECTKTKSTTIVIKYTCIKAKESTIVKNYYIEYTYTFLYYIEYLYTFFYFIYTFEYTYTFYTFFYLIFSNHERTSKNS